MPRADRTLVEDLFADKHIQVHIPLTVKKKLQNEGTLSTMILG